MKKLLPFFLCLLFVTSAFAASLTPRETVEKGTQEILSLMRDPAFKDPAKKQETRQQIEKEALYFFDFEEFSSRTIGPQWKKFTPEQKKRFQTAFTTLLRNTYIDMLDSYSGERAAYAVEISSDIGARVEVKLLFYAKDKTYPFAFRMLEKNDRWVVYDVIIENASLIKNYREQFKDILAKNNPDDLIHLVEKKAQEQAAAK